MASFRLPKIILRGPVLDLSSKVAFLLKNCDSFLCRLQGLALLVSSWFKAST